MIISFALINSFSSVCYYVVGNTAKTSLLSNAKDSVVRLYTGIYDM